MSEDRFAASAREYVESLHQNSRTHLLYGKNNVMVQPVQLLILISWNVFIFFYAGAEMFICPFTETKQRTPIGFLIFFFRWAFERQGCPFTVFLRINFSMTSQINRRSRSLTVAVFKVKNNLEIPSTLSLTVHGV